MRTLILAVAMVGMWVGSASALTDAPTGDVNCDGEVGPADSIALLRWTAGLPVLQAEGCVQIGCSFDPPDLHVCQD